MIILWIVTHLCQKKIFFDTPTVYSLNEIHSRDLIENNSSKFLSITPKIESIEINGDLDLMTSDFKLLNWKSYEFSK